MELKGQAEVQQYVDALEKEIYAIKKSHSYRIGKAVVDYYKGPKIRGLKAFFRNLSLATKKVDLEQNKSTVLLSERVIYQSEEVVVGTPVIVSPTFDFPFVSYKKHIKNKPVVLTIDRNILSTNDIEYHYILPNELEDAFLFLNADELRIDLKVFSQDPLWRGVGTYDEVGLTLQLMDYIEKSSIPINKRLLLGQEYLGNYPLLAQFEHLFSK